MIIRTLLGLILIMMLSFSFVSAESSTYNGQEGAIQKTIEGYVGAFNRGDASAAASHWGKEGTYKTSTGESVRGPGNIKATLEKLFTEEKGISVQVKIFQIRVDPVDRSTATGFAVFKRPEGETEEILFSASLVKENGMWKIVSVQEQDCPVPLSTIAKLGELEWLIGDWEDEDDNARVESSFRWAKDYSFIAHNFAVIVDGLIDIQGTQIIGWDPKAKKIRSWVFDSKAGFGEGEWSKMGNNWTVKSKAMLPDGRKASSMNIYTYVNPNSFRWQSVSREVEGEPLPDVGEISVVRKSTAINPETSGK